MANYEVAVLMKDKDQRIPTDVLTDILAAYPSCIGVAGVVPTKKGPILQVSTARETLTAEAVDKLQEQFLASCVLFAFGNFPEGFQDDDMQPFTVITVDKKPVIVAFLEGDFTGFVEPESTRSPAHHALEKYVAPKLSNLFSAADKDVDKFMKALDDSLIEQELGSVGKAGSVIVLANNGQIKTFTSNEDLHEEDWGFCTVGFEEDGEAAEAAEHAAATSGEGEEDDDLPTLSLGKQQEPSAQPNTADSAAASATADQMIYPPKGLSNNALKNFYKSTFGYLPDNWK